jgi:hypothetical protein
LISNLLVVRVIAEAILIGHAITISRRRNR